MQQDIHYDEVVGDVAGELSSWRAAAIDGGSRPPSGFSSTPASDSARRSIRTWRSWRAARELTRIAPFVIGASRKGFVGHITGRASGPDRMAGSLATVAAAVRGGASIVRVHDVRETVDFLRVMKAIEGFSP